MFLLLYSIKLCIDISVSMSLILSTCVLFILLIQPVNGSQFLNVTFLLLLLPPTGNVATVIVPVTGIHASL